MLNRKKRLRALKLNLLGLRTGFPELAFVNRNGNKVPRTVKLGLFTMFLRNKSLQTAILLEKLTFLCC